MEQPSWSDSRGATPVERPTWSGPRGAPTGLRTLPVNPDADVFAELFRRGLVRCRLLRLVHALSRAVATQIVDAIVVDNDREIAHRSGDAVGGFKRVDWRGEDHRRDNTASRERQGLDRRTACADGEYNPEQQQASHFCHD